MERQCRDSRWSNTLGGAIHNYRFCHTFHVRVFFSILRVLCLLVLGHVNFTAVTDILNRNVRPITISVEA